MNKQIHRKIIQFQKNKKQKETTFDHLINEKHTIILMDKRIKTHGKAGTCQSWLHYLMEEIY